MSGTALPSFDGGEGAPRWHDVRFIGAMLGRYALNARPARPDGTIDIFACRLCSIATSMAVVVAPVIGSKGDGVTAHFDGFGILRGHILKHVPAGFAMGLNLTEPERFKLAAKITWHKKYALNQLSERREHRRLTPSDPRAVMTMAGGERHACFIIDYSASGVAISGEILPDIGVPLAIGTIIGRVIRHLDVGFAVRFIEVQDTERVERRLTAIA